MSKLHRAGVLLALVQCALAIPVLRRMARSANGVRIAAAPSSAVDGQISVIVPVLNEAARLGPCLTGLVQQSDIVSEILIADGGSTDATRQVFDQFAERDRRLRWIDALPGPVGSNGKANNLVSGLEHCDAASIWILTIDADVRPSAALAAAVVAHATEQHVRMLSVATRQRMHDDKQAALHPAMLSTLVYRFGIPGSAVIDPALVQANGQCMLIERELLQSLGGFTAVADSICEDVTMARLAARAGVPVGFYEGGDLVEVEMYRDWQETWRNWSRSLPMRDRFIDGRRGLFEVVLVQAAPLPMMMFLHIFGRSSRLLAGVNLALLLTRLGTLAGMTRAYERTRWTYWLSPLLDLPVALKLIEMSMRRQHTWRGRQIRRGDK